MFETAVLSYGPASKRVWATCMGMTGQMLLVGTAILVPLLFPTALPKPQMFGIGLIAPAPPPPPPGPGLMAARKPALRPFLVQDGKLYEPAKVPEHVTMIDEERPTAAPGFGVIGGTGSPNGVPGGTGLVDSIIGQAAHMAYVPPVIQRLAPAPAAAPAVIPRVRAGGVVKEAIPIRRVEPTYPDMARRMRVSGTVRLEGVIGIDGRITELKVLEGNPLLIQAAVVAVRQWLYRPTTLNGDPVEVVAPIEVIFRLN
jgi:periplasmic protein TonB